MKALLKLLSIALAVPLLCSCSNDKEEKQETNPITRMEESKTRISYIDCAGIPRPDDAFDYPYQDPYQWKEIDTYEKPFQIPQDIVEKQSTMALVRDVLEHPEMKSFWLSNSTYMDYLRKWVFDRLDAFKELSRRKDVGDCFSEVFQLFNPNACTAGGFIKTTLFLLTAQPEIYGNFTSAQRKDIIKEVLNKYKEEGSFMGVREGMLLIGRLLQAEKYEPFLNSVATNSSLADLLETDNMLVSYENEIENLVKFFANEYLTLSSL